MVQPFSYWMPTRVVFGPGSISQVVDEIKITGCKKPILVTDRGVRPLPFFGQLTGFMEKAELDYEVFDSVPGDPDLEDIDSLVGLIRQKGCDSVVAVGGGSVLCAGRGAAVTFPGGTSSRDLVGIGKVRNQSLPMIAVPTTAGSGSEVSGVIVLSDRKNQAIVTIGSPHCFPRLAVLDPDTLADLPPRQAAISGIDAMAHGLEALMTTTPNPVSEALAVHACATLFRKLRSASLTGELEPKAHCLVASAMANIACGNSRLSLGHAMVLPLSARFGVPHGVAAGVLLPHVLKFNLPAAGKRLIPLIMAMGCRADTHPGYLLKELTSLLEDLALPKDLESLNVDESALAEMSQEVSSSPISKCNLRRAAVADILSIYKAAFYRASQQ